MSLLNLFGFRKVKTNNTPEVPTPNFCDHEWSKIDAENSAENFIGYAEQIYRERLIFDFEGLLEAKELKFPIGPNKSNRQRWFRERNLEGDFYYWDKKEEYFYPIEPKVYICLKCMKYKSDMDDNKMILHKLTAIYEKFFKINYSYYLNKTKKIKLNINGEISEVEQAAGHLDSLNVAMKQFNRIHELEKNLISQLRQIK